MHILHSYSLGVVCGHPHSTHVTLPSEDSFSSYTLCVWGLELRWWGVAVYVYPLNYLMLRTLDMRSVLQYSIAAVSMTHNSSELSPHAWLRLGRCPAASSFSSCVLTLRPLPLLWIFYTPHVIEIGLFHLAQPSWFVCVSTYIRNSFPLEAE